MPVDHLAIDAEPVFKVAIEYADGKQPHISVIWSGSQTAADVLAALAEAWKPSGEYSGAWAIDAAWIFGKLIQTLEVAIASRSRGGDFQLSPVIECSHRTGL